MFTESSQPFKDFVTTILYTLNENRKRKNAMKKIMKKVGKKIADYLKEIIDDEMRVMDAFYRQFA
ncbi:hypothetical protein A3H66_01130 [Candidatus Falkowbacteria bacterium RIFCSPLOWO2_02_FULL_45_21]|uniref:Uncharacterized protein n=1 Tax=Candidatus Falkowbacteria bacterium RIFCSPLOWO2_02_FULL_45_21 TaxID=1797989 RepID=A0A1F5SE31_9BACT|nr:MAG: hypothetical protein A3H66_01130 [Candidatus Falkowbacteria bacterium RIFCSPLOWO2_02_FULL_45_21]